jgi:glycosyltransferase involved in cell wall biosynthesis
MGNEGRGVDQRGVGQWAVGRKGVNQRHEGRLDVDVAGVLRTREACREGGRAGAPGLSVVIPAYDEEHAIGACLSSLIEQHDVRLHIVVVANGCRDETAAIARAAAPAAMARGHHLEVVERTTPGKPGALNAGDDRCRPGPRLYLDADVRLGPGAARDLAAALAPGTGTHLAAPTVTVRPPEARFTASYARVWTQLPYVRTQVMGCGAYAVSEAGRRRWNRFPEIGSDDRFVRLTFGPEEQRVLPTSTFTLSLPERARELFALRARWCQGNRQLARRYPHLHARDARRVGPAVGYVLRRPSLWPDLPVFGLLFAYGRIRTWSLREPSATWGRETSSLNRRPDSSAPIRLDDLAPSGELEEAVKRAPHRVRNVDADGLEAGQLVAGPAHAADGSPDRATTRPPPTVDPAR